MSKNQRKRDLKAKVKPTAILPAPQMKEAIAEEAEIDQLEVFGRPDEAASSVLLKGYRCLGYYTSHLPLSITRSDEDTLIASAVGEHSFYVYNADHLSLVYMSRHISERITWL